MAFSFSRQSTTTGLRDVLPEKDKLWVVDQAMDIEAPEANAPTPPINELLHEGQEVIVQIVKDPIGSKGARLSTQISVAGRLLVFLPQDDHLGISQKIGSPELRDQLRERMLRLLGEADSREGRTRSGGFILRTNAEDASDDELAVDIAYLRKTWATIREHGMKAPPGTLLYQELNLAQRVLRDEAAQPGFRTPSLVFGPDYILGVDGTTRIDL